jgi:hypothetical protein
MIRRLCPNEHSRTRIRKRRERCAQRTDGALANDLRLGLLTNNRHIEGRFGADQQFDLRFHLLSKSSALSPRSLGWERNCPVLAAAD